jgi:Na+/proline symporter
MLSLVVPGKLDGFFVVMFSIQALLGIVAQPFIMGVCASGRTEMDGRVGFMVGNIVKRFCTMAWCVTGLAAVAWYMQSGADLSQINPDHVYGDVARAFLPEVMPGLLGVFLAALLAGVMSSCDAFMISSSGLFTKNIYRPLWPNKSERHYVWVGRAAALVVVAGGVLFAYWVPNVVSALNYWFKIAPMMGIAFWLGLFWRRATGAGAWAVTLTGFGVWWLTERTWFAEWLATWPFAAALHITEQNTFGALEVREPWVVLCYAVSALVAGIAVSLLTKPEDEDRLNTFYDLTRTPIVKGENLIQPCRLPEGVSPAYRRMVCTAFGLEIPMPSRTSIIGFLAGWVAVAALIGGFLWLVA